MKNNNNSVNTQEELQKCLSFLADLNGSEWIPGNDAGALDMKQRAKGLHKRLSVIFYPPKTESNYAPSIQSKEEGKQELPENLYVIGNGMEIAPDPQAPPLLSMYSDSFFYSEEEAKKVAARIVQCWNEYDGLKTEVTHIKEMNDKLNGALEKILSMQRGKSLYKVDLPFIVKETFKIANEAVSKK